MEKTFLLEIRNTAKECSNLPYRSALFHIADALAGRITIFAASPTEENMRDLIGTWARAQRVLAECPPPAEPLNPLADRKEWDHKAA